MHRCKMSVIKYAALNQLEGFQEPLRKQLSYYLTAEYEDCRMFVTPNPAQPDINRITDYMSHGNCDPHYVEIVKQRITEFANSTHTPVNSVGAVWEAIVILYCYTYPQVEWVLPWHHDDLKQFKIDYGFSDGDTGIDGVIKLTNGKYALYQCKFTQQGGSVLREQYLSLIAASHRALVLYPDDFSTTILFTTKDYVDMGHNTVQHTTHLHVWMASNYYSKALMLAVDLVLAIMHYYKVRTRITIDVLMTQPWFGNLCAAMPIYKGNIVSPKRDVSLLYDDSEARAPTNGKLRSRERAMTYVTEWEKVQSKRRD